MKRASSIEALLRKSSNVFVDLKCAYEASLHEKNIRDDLKVDIKNIFENLRSCLDYLAHDIYENVCSSAKVPDRLYFPIRATRNEFDIAVNKDYPSLKSANIGIYCILEAVQPYHNPWLAQFNKLNNGNKHQDLIEQTRVESRQVTISRGGGLVSWGPGVTFGNGVSVMGIPIDPLTQMPVPNDVAKTEVTTWIDFRFKENGASVLPFIASSMKNVEKIFHDIQDCL